VTTIRRNTNSRHSFAFDVNVKLHCLNYIR